MSALSNLEVRVRDIMLTFNIQHSKFKIKHQHHAMSTLDGIIQHKIVAILRGVKPKDVLNVVSALYEGGIRLVEVTLNSQDPFSQIETVNHEFGNKMLVGAGTVLDTASAKMAIKSGARFLISPVVDADVIRIARENQVVSIPGAYTATEIFFAHKSVGDII